MGREEEIRITKSELSEMIASAVSAAVAATRAAAPAPGPVSVPFDADEQLRKQAAMLRPEGPPTETIRRVHFRTGMAGTLVIFKGKVIGIQEETYPPGYDVHKKAGGLVPDALTILNRDGQKTPQYKQWLWKEVRQPTLEDLIGKSKEDMMRLTNGVDEAAPVA